MDLDARPFRTLDPLRVLQIAESFGLDCDGRVLALNSFENRVFRVGLHDAAPVVLKCYRPGRWTDACIEEEHAFAAELVEAGASVVAPLRFEGATLHHRLGHRVALFPLCAGRAPELGDRASLTSIGRMLGLIHAVGARSDFGHRPRIDVAGHGDDALDRLLRAPLVPADLKDSLAEIGDAALDLAELRWDAVDPVMIRLHGDCHPGNLLWREGHAHFVDLDDCATGPAMQDLWMLLGGDPRDRDEQLEWLLEGYRQFGRFDAIERALVEPLRLLRMLHHHAWIVDRWGDPAFPAAFPGYAERTAWEGFLRQLQEQLAVLQDADT